MTAHPDHDKYVYRFGNGEGEGDRSMKPLLGGKGANLNEMSRIGLPVPPGFTISTEACRHYTEHEGTWPEGMSAEVDEAVRHIEEAMNRQFGDASDPLLVSVRSGAALSMPGMMDSVLNLGLNDEGVEGLARKAGDERFAYDAYRRLIDMFGDVVMGLDRQQFEHALETMKQDKDARKDIDLDAEDLKRLVDRYKAIYRKQTGYMFPQDPREQLRFAIDAVFDSWNNDRARKYRRINKITGLLGTAVNVQAMVFGNMGERSGTGVCFTRNPATGERTLYGEFLVNAQGEDVVAGLRTPEDISDMERDFPEAYDELLTLTQRLEQHYQNMQDIEFTVQNGTLYILQTRDGKRTGQAALQIANDMVEEGLVDAAHAVRELVDPSHLDQLLHPQFKPGTDYSEDVIGTGLPASPGAAVGRVVFTAEDAEAWKADGRPVVLVRIETSPEDIAGMDAAEGILTSRGGMTSHAAVVARGWGKPCVAGCPDIVVNYKAKTLTNGAVTVEEGDWISINGSTGEIILGEQELVEPEISRGFAQFMRRVDALRTTGVRANADTPQDAQQALDFGAEGIGLCRTEHMFFEGDRIQSVRSMILASGDEARKEPLEELLPYQRADFRSIFEVMDGLPVTIRLLDPPLHEFLPHDEKGMQDMADRQGVEVEEVRKKVEALSEFNPMLGHRGCRLGVTMPSITAMQARAILEAALEAEDDGFTVHPEIMVPLVGTRAEFVNQKAVIDEAARAVFEEKGHRIDYTVGTMIEVPRAALQGGAIAEEAAFFSFGTNDLTQMTFGYSRDDAGSFLPYYVEHKILPDDPFIALDQSGVGELVKLGTERGRQTKADLKVGICGEHGGEPSSVQFCCEAGLDYVSCSPFRLPIARLAAAKAALKDETRPGKK